MQITVSHSTPCKPVKLMFTWVNVPPVIYGLIIIPSDVVARMEARAIGNSREIPSNRRSSTQGAMPNRFSTASTSILFLNSGRPSKSALQNISGAYFRLHRLLDQGQWFRVSLLP